MDKLLDLVRKKQAAQRTVISAEIEALLGDLSVVDGPTPTGPGAFHGQVQLDVQHSLFGFASLNLSKDLFPKVDFDLTDLGPSAAPNGFRVDLILATPSKLGRLAEGFLKGGAYKTDGNGQAKVEWIEALPDPAPVEIDGPALVIRIEGRAGETASLTVKPRLGNEAIEGVVTINLNPPFIAFGGTGFGLGLPNGIILDDSDTEKPPPAHDPDGVVVVSDSDVAGWRGLAIRDAQLFIPRGIPAIGGTAIPIHFELGKPTGINASTKVHVPGGADKPDIIGRIEIRDPTATSLADCLPTLIELTVELLAKGHQAAPEGDVGGVTLGGGQPLRMKATFARDPRVQPNTMTFTLGLEAIGDDGLVSVTAPGAGAGAKIFITAAVLATALIADSQFDTAPSGDASGRYLHLLLTAALGVSAFFENEGGVVVHAVELISEGTTAALVDKLKFRVDYSVDAMVTSFTVGVLAIGMKPHSPMRVRYRDVVLEIDLRNSGLDMFHLSFDKATAEVEDPGNWCVHSPGSILDIVGTRSGRGSTWFEIDLRFALDLGPVKVSGATVRAELGSSGAHDVSLRGLGASLHVPGVIDATGAFRLIQKTPTDPGGFEAALAVDIIPIGVNASGYLGLKGDLIIIALDVELPGPLPIANSGLGLYGIGGIYGLNAAAKPPAPADDPILYQLNWKPDLGHLDHRAGGMMFGFSATIGTLPDLGFSFHAKAGILLGVPDFSFRAGLDGTLFAPVGDEGVGTFLGILVIDNSIIDNSVVVIGLRGEYQIPYLLDVVVPIGARFPSHDANWFVHVGSDNVAVPGKALRGPGPIQARILPDLLPVDAWAYVMVRGDGIEWLGGDKTLNFSGFALGIGIGFQERCGVAPIYLDMSASALIGLGTHPLILAGTGRFDGSLHLGPVSIGVDADVQLQVGPGGDKWADFHACASVDLFFFDLEGCVDVTIGEKSVTVPDPTEWPLLRIGLSDHLYRSGADAATDAANAPVVWPDVIPILQFAVGPASALTIDSAPQFLAQLTLQGQPSIWAGDCGGDGRTGSDELSYTYFLNGMRLLEIDGATETPVAGTLADGSAGLEACWLVPKSGDATDWSGARELALMCWETHLWMRRLVDGGAGLPHDPVSRVADYCRPARKSVPGWALGADALRVGPDWRLPPERLAPNPFLSRVDLTIHVTWETAPFTAQAVAGMPAPSLYSPARVETLPVAVDAGRQIVAAFDLPEVVTPPLAGEDRVIPVEPNQLVAHVAFAVPAFDIELWILVTGARANEISVSDDKNGTWAIRPPTIAMPNGRSAILVTRNPVGEPLSELLITYPFAIDIGVLGVRAITTAAKQNADAANGAAKAAGSNNDNKKNQPVLNRRHLLKPGTLYRIDVDMSCIGERLDGGKTVAGPTTFPAAPSLHSQSFWFKTAELKSMPFEPGQSGYLKALARGQSRFDTSQLERYLLGYDPVDKTTNWLCDDPLAVHFAVDHVAALAKLYGHGFELRFTRIDAPRAESPLDGTLALTFGELERKDLACTVDQRLADHIALSPNPCPLPEPGLTAKAKVRLEPQARYSLAVHLPASTGSGVAVLPGIVFQTSRFRNEIELFADLRFNFAGTAAVTGDLAVATANLTGPAVLISDAGLDYALDQLGLTPWPLARKGQTSALWSEENGTWRLIGVFLESPEPIERPGRIVIKGLTSGPHSFEILRRNTSATRILYLTQTPFVPASPLTLHAAISPTLPWPFPPGPFAVDVKCNVSTTPSFAKELG